MTDVTEWKNRIIGHGVKKASQFTAHPNNWRKHPQRQRSAVRGSLDSLGWVDVVIENKTTGHVVDGHERIWNALKNGDAEVPYIEVELTEAEEAQALLSLDAIAALAETDGDNVQALLEQVQTDNADVMKFLTDFAAESGLVDYLGGEVTEDKEKADKVKGNVDLIYTAGTYGTDNALTHCCLAVKSGWLYGYQSKDNPCKAHEIQKAHKPQFIDNNYFNFDWERHLAAIKLHRPKYCTVMDVMTKEQCQESGVVFHQYDQIIEWAEELSQYSENVIVIPKYDCISKIPEKFMLGYSVPTSHGGTPLPIQAFAGRRVHLLGGSPNKQIQFFERIPESVVSLDNNYILKIANFGVAWCPDGKQRSLTELGFGLLNNPLYVALAISLGNFAGYFLKKSIDGDIQNGEIGDIE